MTYSVQCTNIQVEAYHKDIPSQPQDTPHCILQSEYNTYIQTTSCYIHYMLHQLNSPSFSNVNCTKSKTINITYRYYILRTILKCAKEAEYNKYYVEEVSKDGGPHIAQEIKHLTLHC